MLFLPQSSETAFLDLLKSTGTQQGYLLKGFGVIKLQTFSSFEGNCGPFAHKTWSFGVLEIYRNESTKLIPRGEG